MLKVFLPVSHKIAPVRERGLKWEFVDFVQHDYRLAPVRERGLKSCRLPPA